MLSRNALSLGLLCIGVALAVFRLSELSVPFHVYADWAFQDFLGVVYYPAVAFLVGDNPYNAAFFLNNYPVFFAFPPFLPAVFLVHLPFALLPQTLAIILYTLTVLGLIALLSYASLRIAALPTRFSSVVLIMAMILISRPGHSNLLLGQTAAQFGLVTYMAYYFAGRSTALGVVGLVFSVLKPTFGIPLALLLMARGHIRLVLIAALVAVALNVPFVIMLVEMEGSLSALVQSLIASIPTWSGHEYVDPATSATRIDLGSVIGRWSGVAPTAVGQILILVGTIGTAALASAGGAKKAIHGMQHLLFGIALLAILLCAYHVMYDLIILAAPFVAIAGRRFPTSFYSGWHYPISVLLLCFLALNYLAGNTIIGLFAADTDIWKLLASANTIALISLYLAWLHAIRKALALESDVTSRHVPERGLPGDIEN